MSGISRRLKRLFPGGKTVVLAFDQAFEHGPSAYPGIDLSPERIFSIAEKGGADAVMVHKGLVKRSLARNVSLIVKITGKTSLNPVESQSASSLVEDAVALGADAIAATIYLGVENEGQMISQFARIKGKAREYGLPVIAFMYPRPKKKEDRKKEEFVKYAARVGSELGADVVKTYYTGGAESWRRVVGIASGTRVVAAGGEPKGKPAEALQMVEDIVSAGGAGIAIGRNVWTRSNAVQMLKAVASIIHGGKTAKQAEKIL